MKANLHNPVPDIAELVTYKTKWRTETMRVAGWYCLQKISKPKCDIITKILRESSDAVGFKLVPCARKNATVVELVGVAGALVRITDKGLTREGEYVQWDKQFIKEQKDSWKLRYSDKDRMVNGLGSGYRDTLERLYPEVNFNYPY